MPRDHISLDTASSNNRFPSYTIAFHPVPFSFLLLGTAFSGAVVNAKSTKQGELYAKWKRNSNRTVGREGDEEDFGGLSNEGASKYPGGRRLGGSGKGGGAAAGQQGGDRVVRDELRTKAQIRKAKQKVNLKN